MTCNNKRYTQATMGVADYSKPQLKTVRFPLLVDSVAEQC